MPQKRDGRKQQKQDDGDHGPAIDLGAQPGLKLRGAALLPHLFEYAFYRGIENRHQR